MIDISHPFRLKLDDQVYKARLIAFPPDKTSRAYLVTDYIGPSSGDKKDSASYEKGLGAVGELAVHFGRFDRPKDKEPVHQFRTLDSAVRQSLEIVNSSIWRGAQLRAQRTALSNVASFILGSWQDMSADQRQEIEAALALLSDKLQKASNPLPTQASTRVEAVVHLKDSLGRDNPLITSTRLDAAARDLRAEKLQHEMVIKASQTRQTHTFSLAAVVNSNIGRLLARLRNHDVPESELMALLDSVAIKPYYFAAVLARILLKQYGVTPKTVEMIELFFRYEAGLIVVSDVLSILRKTDEGSLYSSLAALSLPDRPNFAPYQGLHDDLADTLAQLKRLYQQPKGQWKEKFALKLIDTFKRQVRYRPNW